MTHSIGDRFGDRFGDPFGREPATEPSSAIHVSVDIAAAPDVVFRAIADPRELVTWLGDAESSEEQSDEPSGASSDDRQSSSSPDIEPMGGSHWLAHVRAPDGTTGTVSGEFLSVVPPRSLVTTWAASWNRFVQDEVTFHLAPIDVAGLSGTRVTVTHRRRAERLVRSATIASARAMAAAETEAWATLLDRLSAYVTTIDALARWGDPAGGDLSHIFDALHRRVVAIHQGESA